MIKKILIVRGVESADDLRSLGLPIAQRFSESEIVIGIATDGKCRVFKHRAINTDQISIIFVDGDSQIVEFSSIIRKIEDAYRKAHPDDSHLSQAFVGLWMFYWMGDGDRLILPIEMAERGDISMLQESAESFIASDFGNITPGMDMISADGESDASST
jgi:hypothetical protein